MFHKVRQLDRFQSVKVTFKVIQGHWQWCHLIGHIRFPISLPLQLCLYLAPKKGSKRARVAYLCSAYSAATIRMASSVMGVRPGCTVSA